MNKVIQYLIIRVSEISTLKEKAPNLETVFLMLTGRNLMIPIPIFLEEKGDCRYILGVSRDISKKKKYDKLPREAQSDLKAIDQPQLGAIIEVEKRGNDCFFTVCVGPLIKQFGFTPEDVIEKRPQDLFPPDMAKPIIEQYELCWNTGEKIPYEWSGQTETTEFCWLAMLTPVIEDGEMISFVIYDWFGNTCGFSREMNRTSFLFSKRYTCSIIEVMNSKEGDRFESSQSL